VSAQIITALRKRARKLDSEADDLEASGAGDKPGTFPPMVTLRLLASEFRILADTAEAP
jgi:hypothetical protein